MCSIYVNVSVGVGMLFRAFALGGLQSGVNGLCQLVMAMLMATSNGICEEKALEIARQKRFGRQGPTRYW